MRKVCMWYMIRDLTCLGKLYVVLSLGIIVIPAAHSVYQLSVNEFLGGLFGMQVRMRTWEGLPVEEMIWNHLHIHSFFFTEAGCHGKDFRYLHQLFSSRMNCMQVVPLNFQLILFSQVYLLTILGR